MPASLPKAKPSDSRTLPERQGRRARAEVRACVLHLPRRHVVAVGGLLTDGVEPPAVGAAGHQVSQLPVLDRVRTVCTEHMVDTVV